MNKILLCLTTLLLLTLTSFAQDKADTIYTFNKTIIANVKEVGHQEILYSLPNEEVVYRMYKRAVLSIAFSNGRQEFFNDKKDMAPLKTSNEWKSVTVTNIPEEIGGMIKIDRFSVKATGATVYSSVTGTQDRAFQKLKQAAAMLGGNVVLVNDQSVEGNVYSERTTRTQLTGTIYRSLPMDTTGLFKNLVNHRFATSSKKILGVNSREPSINRVVYPVQLKTGGVKNFEFISGILYYNVNLNEEVTRFIVTYHSASSLILAYQHKSRFVEITLNRVKD